MGESLINGRSNLGIGWLPFGVMRPSKVIADAFSAGFHLIARLERASTDPIVFVEQSTLRISMSWSRNGTNSLVLSLGEHRHGNAGSVSCSW